MKLFYVGMGGVLGYCYLRDNLDRKQEHPLVQEAMVWLEANKEITDYIGSPIAMKTKWNNRASIDDTVANFNFEITGPRGKLSVELAGSCAAHGNIGTTREAKDHIYKENLRKKPEDLNNTEDKKTLDNLNFLDYRYLVFYIIKLYLVFQMQVFIKN